MARQTKELKLPSQLLDRIGGEGFDDRQWRESHNFGTKRKSRKETRKEQRKTKKQKTSRGFEGKARSVEQAELKSAEPKPVEKRKPVPKPSKEKASKSSDKFVAPFVSKHEEELRKRDEEDAKYYAKKLGLKSLKLKDENDGFDDLLGDLDFDHFSDENSGSGSGSDSGSIGDDEDVYSQSDNDSDASMTAEETMAKLAALKKGKGGGSNDIRIVKEDELDDSEEDLSGSDFEEFDDESDENESMTAEETMAKLAALKKGKNTSEGKLRVVKEDELDDDSDLFEGDSSDDDNEEEMTAEETMAKLAALKKGKNNNEEKLRVIKEDELSDDSDIFDDDSSDDDEEEEEMTAEETMAKLAALKAKKTQKTDSQSHVESDSDEELSDSDDDDDDDENPYVPPKRRARDEADNDASSGRKQDTEAILAMRRVFKSSLNKLTESTFAHVTNEIGIAFLKNSRAEASEVLTAELLEMVDGPQPLQPTMYVMYAAVVAAMYQQIGIGFAAHLVQELVERIVANYAQGSNLMSLLAECYSLNVVSSRLMYDLMKKLLRDIDSADNMPPVELLLVIIRNAGSQLRSDDPVALKEVIVLLQQRMQELGGGSQLSPRMRFLVDSIVALKNNRQKPVSELVISLRHRLKKTMQSSGSSRNSSDVAKEPMQVGLDDILDSKTRGKWWLVGASWKGGSDRTAADDDNDDKLDIDMDDEFGSSTTDWLQLAKKQRLNTDVRRAVFVALMGAEDYLDACLRIDKLGLKNKQERDVPHVILHCLVQEPFYNPYYALVAGKQCSRHSTMKTFQFRLWDWLNTEPTSNPRHAMQYGRFYGSLVSSRAMPLDVIKMVDFLAGSSDTQIFTEFFCVTLYKDAAKEAEKIAKRSAQRGFVPSGVDVDRDGKEFILMLSKVKEPTVLRGLQLVNKNIVNSEAIQSPKDRARVQWAAQLSSDIIEELVRKKNEQS